LISGPPRSNGRGSQSHEFSRTKLLGVLSAVILTIRVFWDATVCRASGSGRSTVSSQQSVGNLSPKDTASRHRKPESSKFLLCKYQRILKHDWMQRTAAGHRMDHTLTQTLNCVPCCPAVCCEQYQCATFCGGTSA